MSNSLAIKLIGIWALALSGLLFAPALVAEPYYPPLESVLDTDSLPSDSLAPVDDGSGTGIEDRIRVKEFVYSEVSVQDGPTPEDTRDVGARIHGEFIIDDGFELAVPGLEAGFTFVVGEGEVAAQINMLGEPGIAEADRLANGIDTGDFPLVATFSANPFPLKLRLSPEFFTPYQDGDSPGTYKPFPEGTAPEAVEIELNLNMSVVIRYDWDGNSEILFDDGTAGAFPGLTVDQPFMLADTGIIVDLGNILIDLSDLNSPNATLDPTWKGIFFKQFAVAFNNGLAAPTSDISVPDGSAESTSPGLPGVNFADFSIGTGGFSGSICGTGLSQSMDFLDMNVTLQELCVEFQQNTISGSAIKVALSDFPFFDDPGVAGDNALVMALALDLDGNFTIGLAAPGPGGLVTLSVDSVLDFRVKSAFFEHRAAEELFLVGLNGELELLFLAGDSGGNAKIDVNGLTLDSEGNVSLDGGWITLPEKVSTDFKTFNVSLSQIGFGRTDPDPGAAGDLRQSWVGFSGGISLVAGLGAEAEMKRMQFLWPKQKSGGLPGVDVKVEGIGVAFEQPNVVRFEGNVEWFETVSTSPGTFASEGFAGKLNLNLLALNLVMNSRVVIGSASTPQAFKYFFLDVESQFPAGIPLGNSGVSFYGFLGMLAYNMEPNISAFDSPVQWVNANTRSDNVVLTQSGDPGPTWGVRPDALAFGAGIIVGTTPDNGFTVNGKIALTIAVPGPVVMLNGQANILKERGSLSDTSSQPLFVAVALFDGRENTFILNVGVFYDLAKVIKASGEAEAYFDLDNPANWHFYLGQKTPESRRLTASVLSLFTASSYYMIDPYALQFGAKASWGNRWKFGPLKVVIEAWMSYDAGLSWRPIHAWGEIAMHGAVELSAFGVGLGLSADAGLALQAPKPYVIDGKFKVKLNLPWPLPDPKATVHVRWSSHEDALPEMLTEVVDSMTLHTVKDAWVFEPSLQVHSANAPSTPTWPGLTIAESDLTGPAQSIPPDGSAEVPSTGGGFRPLVPLDTFMSMKFEKSLNDVPNLALGNPYNSASPILEEIDGHSLVYNARAYVLYQGPKDTSPYDLAVNPDTFANWPVVPLTASQQAFNVLDIASKNSFRYYTNTTYLGYNNEGDEWTEWTADHYGYSWCLDDMNEREKAKQWDNYHFYTPPVDPGETGGYYPEGYIPVDQKPGQPVHCPLQLDWMDGEDFILPAYHVFRLTFLGDAQFDGNLDREYAYSIEFHTEGPPLNLADYVRLTVPEFPTRPHFRDYHVSLQFNENYMNKLYREDGNFLQIQLLDENETPINGIITTDWATAESHNLSESEQAWEQQLEDLGVTLSSADRLDDVIHGDPIEPSAMRASQNHIARVWLEDPRLSGDARLDSAEWLDRHNIGYFDKPVGRVVLYEFNYTTSKFDSLTEFVASQENAAGDYYTLSVMDNLTTVGQNHVLNRNFADGTGSIHHSDSEDIGVFLRHLLSPRSPDSFTDAALHEFIARTPGYADDMADLVDADLAHFTEIQNAWKDSLSAYDTVEKALDLNRNKEPLPESLEVNLLTRRSDGTAIGWLLESPESLDFSRISLEYADPVSGADDVLVIPNTENTRFFVFLVQGASYKTLVDGTHTVTFTYHFDIGEENPFVFNDAMAGTESVDMTLSIPGGEIRP